jgi:HEPN domain-containing protein
MEEWKEMISVANIFSDSTKMLETLQMALLKVKNDESVKLSKTTMIPIIVLKAFACEMYLKSYLSKDGSSSIPKTHNLYELYRNLNKTTKNKINKTLVSKMNMINKNYNQSSIESDILSVANTFEEWRYFYESNYTLNFLFLNTFYDTLIDSSIHPPV